MRKIATSRLSFGARGAGTGVAGSRAGVQAAAAASAAAIHFAALAAVGIARNRRRPSRRFVADEQGEIRSDRDALRLPVAPGGQLAASEDLPGGIDLRVDALDP